MDLVLSASSLKTYKQCGRKFHLYKILKAQPSHEPFHYGWVGTIVHNCIYYSIADYIDEQWHVGAPKSWSKVESFFEDLWEGDIQFEVSRHLVEDGEVKPDKPHFKPESMKDKKYQIHGLTEEQRWKMLARDLVKIGYSLMVKNILPGYKEVQLEQEIRFSFDERINVLGYIDILCRTDKGRVHFYDLKTSRMAPRSLDNDIQFYLYRYGLRNLQNLKYFPEGHYVHLRSKKVTRIDTANRSVIRRNDAELHKLIDGVFAENWEPNLYQVLCGFCEFRGYCYGSNGEYIEGKIDNKLEVMESMMDVTGTAIPLKVLDEQTSED